MKSRIQPRMKVGAEPKKVAILVGLLVLAGVLYFMNSSGGAPESNAPVSTAPRPLPAATASGARTPTPPASIARAPGRTNPQGRVSTQEFRPTLKPKEPLDPSRIDPTLRLDLLAKLKNIRPEGASRSLFDFGVAPAAEAVKIEKVAPVHPGLTAKFIGPAAPKPPPPKLDPPPPPIPLKFYGYTNAARTGPKRAFFLEGEDIFIAGEGDIIKSRYKVVRIGVNSAVVEDTANKHQQTLPLEQEQAG
jgi:hypothetical protein